jgi:mRNA-degrading endonuclease YafQ of YafQ-DinJ toxin-antitoxin module
LITIRFATNKLEKAFRELKEGTKLWGEAPAKKYIERVNALQAVNNVSEFANAFPQYRDHPLKGDKKHLRAFTLHDRLRVEYEPDADGKEATIREVSTHYGD